MKKISQFNFYNILGADKVNDMTRGQQNKLIRNKYWVKKNLRLVSSPERKRQVLPLLLYEIFGISIYECIVYEFEK